MLSGTADHILTKRFGLRRQLIPRTEDVEIVDPGRRTGIEWDDLTVHRPRRGGLILGTMGGRTGPTYVQKDLSTATRKRLRRPGGSDRGQARGPAGQVRPPGGGPAADPGLRRSAGPGSPSWACSPSLERTAAKADLEHVFDPELPPVPDRLRAPPVASSTAGPTDSTPGAGGVPPSRSVSSPRTTAGQLRQPGNPRPALTPTRGPRVRCCSRRHRGADRRQFARARPGVWRRSWRRAASTARGVAGHRGAVRRRVPAAPGRDQDGGPTPRRPGGAPDARARRGLGRPGTSEPAKGGSSPSDSWPSSPPGRHRAQVAPPADDGPALLSSFIP